MNVGRALLLLLYVGELAVAAFFAALAVGSVLDNMAQDPFDIALSRIAVAAGLSLVVMAFAGLLSLRGFARAAPFLFALSFVAVGVTTSVTRGIAKGFPTATDAELPALYALHITIITAALVLAAVAWWWTKRQSRFPLV